VPCSTVTPFWWAPPLPGAGDYDGYAVPYKGGGENGVSRQKTLPVKSFEPNPWDSIRSTAMSGMVRGSLHDDYYGAPHDGSAWPRKRESRCFAAVGDFYPGARAAHRDIVDIFWTGTRFLSLRLPGQLPFDCAWACRQGPRITQKDDEAQAADDEAVRHILRIQLAAAQRLRRCDNRAIQ